MVALALIHILKLLIIILRVQIASVDMPEEVAQKLLEDSNDSEAFLNEFISEVSEPSQITFPIKSKKEYVN